MNYPEDIWAAAKRALQNSAWPLPWRVSDRDVKQAVDAWKDGRAYVFAGDTWLWVNGEALRQLHCHEDWREWFRRGNVEVLNRPVPVLDPVRLTERMTRLRRGS